MKTEMKHKLAAGLLMAAFMASYAMATPILQVWQDGDVYPFANWTSLDYDGGAPVVGNPMSTIGELDGRDAIILDPGSLANPATDLIFTTDAALIGNLTTFAGMQFDFYAGANGDGTGAPAALEFYFQTATERWFYTIGGSYIQDGWYTYSIPFVYGVAAYGYTGWLADPGTNTEVGFGDALGQVTGLGISITYLSGVEKPDQEYGIGLMGLTVPEPETYMVLGMALLSVAFVFRKRITDSLAEVRATLQM